MESLQTPGSPARAVGRQLGASLKNKIRPCRIPVEVHFIINAWAAFAPGLASAEDWQAWARSPYGPLEGAQAEVKAMPPMSRRRLNALGRMAAEVAYTASDAVGFPTIFASRYGDASRSLELLSGLAQGEAVSPTAFGLSVQNAIGAMVSMVRDDRANMLALAGGAASAASGILEAVSLLTDGAPEVLLVHYDAPLPTGYAHFQDEPAAAYAWGWRMALSPAPGAQGFTLTRSWADAAQGGTDPCRGQEGVSEASVPTLPLGLALLRAAILPRHRECLWRDGVQWTLQAHD